ncbi:helix-turn-helix transcriptional regulator [Anaerostipes sp.]|uniref:helix-turn-helix transcriptional regulator n=1 Tax=Anaerostipes sp. TaxID=1872530 RepID=UPI002580D6FA|nr:WYL domain-containing transcriptional regulator [Anaerostipes sp.]
MSISKNKLKILYIMKTLLEKSDEKHPLSAADLNRELGQYGLSADRKTIYNDIDTLREFGIDIIQNKGGKDIGYYVGSREFELPELKLLVDSVQSSKFITSRKSEELIRKLEKLAGEYNAKQLQRNVFIYNRLKADNERIYYNVDRIHEAILENRRIAFQYTEWTIKRELVPKKNGAYYAVSPWTLTWNDDNYYLIAYDEHADMLKHYRVDKMKDTSLLQEQRLGEEKFHNFDLAAFSKKMFGMYGGRDEEVTLLCHRQLTGVILDRFGQDAMLIPEGEEQFRVRVLVTVSPQFFGWVAGLGDRVSVQEPESVKKEYRIFLENILKRYQ